MKLYSRRSVLKTVASTTLISVSGCISNLSSGNSDCNTKGVSSHSELDLSGSESWPMHRFNAAHTNFNPNTNGPRNNIKVAWRYTNCSGGHIGPVIRDEVVHAGRLRLNARTGERLGGSWKTGMETGALGERLYFTNHFNLQARDPGSGDTQWTYDGVSNGGISTFNDGVVYQCGEAGDPNVYAVNVDGSEEWVFQTQTDVNTPPAVSAGQVFVIDENDVLYAIDEQTGNIDWQDSRPENIQYSPPAVSNGKIFVGSRDGGVLALDASDGSVCWKQMESSVDFSIQNGPAVADDTVIVAGAGGNIATMDGNTGDVIWSESLDVGDLGVPVVSNDTIYVGEVPESSGSKVLGIDASEGSKLWQFETRKEDTGHSGKLAGITGSPAIVNGCLYIVTAAQDIYALE